MMQGSETLPKTIRRPLRHGAVGIGVFLILCIVWAIFAPLATTITLHGSIRSSLPSFTLQHPYGGLISEVYVDVHDKVALGQPLLQFDVSLEQETLAAQNSIRDRLSAENKVISEILKRKTSPSPLSELTQRSQHYVHLRQVTLQEETARLSETSLKRQIGALTSKIGHGEEQLALMAARASRVHALGNQGLSRRSDEEALQEQILIVKGEIEADQASAYNLQNQLSQTQQQQDMALIAFERELTSIRHRNMQHLDELKGTILDLTDRIEKSVVRAPIDGLVANLPITAKHSLANRGATLLTLARPLEQARVSFIIPVEYIDQIQPGMSARLNIPSLPQREMPQIDLILEAISPRASVDENGDPVGFEGVAQADIEAFQKFERPDGKSVLSEDMPVILQVSARETTFGDYLLSPLLSAFSKALQD